MNCHSKKIIFFTMVLGTSQVSWGACDKTLSFGADVASAVSSAADGSTVCLNNGDYGSVNFSGINKSNYVTVQSTSGQGATISPNIDSSKFLRFKNLTISGSTITNASSNIQIMSSTFTQGLLINMRGSSKTNYPLNLLVDSSTFSNLGPALWEGRISIGDDDGPQPSMGVTLSNNQIKDGCLSDGVDVVGGASGVQVGPGNIFSNIVESGPVHCDMVQFYGSGQNNTITGNWFRDGSAAIQHQGGTPDKTVVTNNLFSNIDQLSIGGSTNFIFEHNTIFNMPYAFGFSYMTNLLVRNNILAGNTIGPDMTGDTGTFSYQLCSTSSACFGANQIIGNPIFVGGSNPTTWAGFKLASNSLGYKSGSDGQDQGTNYYGNSVVSLTPPMNLRIIN
ncbi:MAG: hypothetical protein ACXVCP_06595 [Bdellovibrio sp.]